MFRSPPAGRILPNRKLPSIAGQFSNTHVQVSAEYPTFPEQQMTGRSEGRSHETLCSAGRCGLATE